MHHKHFITHKHLYPSLASCGCRDHYLVSFGRASPFAKAILSALADESVGPCCSYFRYFTLSTSPHQSTATTFYTPAVAPRATVTWPLTAAAGAGGTNSLPVFDHDPRSAGWEVSPLDPGPVDAQPTTVADTQDQTSGQERPEDQEKEQQQGPDPEPRANPSAEKSQADLKPDESSPQCGADCRLCLVLSRRRGSHLASEPRQEEASDVQPKTDLIMGRRITH